MDLISLYQDYGVNYAQEGHRHWRPGWVNSECPFCTGNPGYHLGYNEDDEYFYCWRCGWHPILLTLSFQLPLKKRQIAEILRGQNGISNISQLQIPKSNKKLEKKNFRIPSSTEPLNALHKRYLIKRKFDPHELEKTWNIVGTGPISLLDKVNFKHRIIVPIIWDGQEVSFTSRDITNRHPLKYISCPENREIIHHKSILYGRQERWKSSGICVEGPADVWRLGVSSFATFGIQFTSRQVREIAKNFKRVAVMFDDDPQATVQANKLIAELKFRNVDAFKVDIKNDPGDMDQSEANYLVKQLI